MVESGSCEISRLKFIVDEHCKKCLSGKWYLNYKCEGCTDA